MKYLKTYDLFERKDVERLHRMTSLSRNIMELIGHHINKCISHFYSQGNFSIDSGQDEDMKIIKYNNITINIEDGKNISYAKDMEGKLYLFLGFETLNNIIEKNEKVEPEKLYDKLTTWERMALNHEITHKMDDEVFDLFKDALLKLYKTDDIEIYKNLEPEERYKSYLDKYNDLPTEYNAMFLAVLNELKDKEYDSFDDFKQEFKNKMYIHNPEFMEKTKFRKKVLNRLYDAYMNYILSKD
jgi:hypothetical protein